MMNEQMELSAREKRKNAGIERVTAEYVAGTNIKNRIYALAYPRRESIAKTLARMVEYCERKRIENGGQDIFGDDTDE